MTVNTLKGAAPNAIAQFNSGGPANGTISLRASFNQGSNPVINDQVELFWLPRGAQIVNALLRADAMETNAAPALALEVGVEANSSGDVAALPLIFVATDGVFAQSLPLRVGPEKMDHAAFGHVFNDRTKVVLTWTHAAGTFVAGNVDVIVQYVTPGNAVSG